jgi:uncharacterized protein
MVRHVRIAFWLVPLAIGCFANEPEVKMEMVAMQDGVRLATDIYLPGSVGKPATERFPVLVYRSPYGRRGAKGDALYLVARGYVVVAQDVRGRGDSEGDFYPFIQEGQDGYDTLEWAAAQNWSNGKVGTFGASYLAWDQYFASMYKPPHLRAMFTLVGGANFYQDFAYPGGVPNLSWPTWMVKSALTGRSGTAEAKAALAAILENPAEWYRQSPEQRAKVFAPFRAQARVYKDYYEHPTPDAYWKQKGFYNLDSYGDMKDVPTVFLTGWYDYFADGVLHNFKTLAAQRRTPQKLIVGPWPHPTGEDTCGGAFYGKAAAVDQRALMADWFDHWMKGAQLKLISADPVHFFRMGGGTDQTKPGKLAHGGTWLNAGVWPPPAKQVSYFLEAGGQLATSPAASEGLRTLIYDPRHPAPTIGGRYGMGGWSPNCAQDQVCSRKYFGCENDLPLNQRADVLSFVGKPLDHAVEVTGPVRAKLWVSSDARDTDVMVKLIDVYPDGYAMLLSVGQLRMRYRDGYNRAALMKPGERYQVGVELGSVSNLFAAGHRVRVDITSSDYPRLEPNPNTGAAIGTSTDPVVAKNTIHFSARQPSRIELPVITR